MLLCYDAEMSTILVDSLETLLSIQICRRMSLVKVCSCLLLQYVLNVPKCLLIANHTFFPFQTPPSYGIDSLPPSLRTVDPATSTSPASPYRVAQQK